MGLLTENRVNIKAQNHEKTSIQRKLEEWEKPAPSKEFLSVKMKQANERRVEVISNTTKRAAEHCNEVKSTVRDLNSQKIVEALALEAKLEEKATKAREHKKERISIFAKKNKQIEEKIIQKKESDQISATQLQAEVDEKIKAAVQRKGTFMIKNHESLSKKEMKIKKVKEHDLEKAKNLEAMVISKLDAATDRKMKVLSELSTNVSSSVKQKEERIKLLKYSKEANLSSAKMKSESKIVEANQRKENSIFNRKVMSAEKNYAKSERTKEHLKRLVFNEREVQCKNENKMTAVLKRKDRIQAKENEKNEKMNVRREIVFENHAKKENCSVQKAKEQTSVKIIEATQRRTGLQVKENERNDMMNKKREIAIKKHNKNENCFIQKAKEQTSVKINEATVRRAAHLLRKTEHAGAIGDRSRCNSEKSHKLSPNAEYSDGLSIVSETTNERPPKMEKKSAQLSEDNTYQPFHVKLQTLSIAILSHIVGIIHNLFSRSK